MRAFALFITCTYFLTSSATSIRASEPSQAPAQPSGKEGRAHSGGDSCARCHKNAPQKTATSKTHSFSCSHCHQGNPASSVEQEAHTGLIAQPAHPFSMGQICGPCHPEQVAGVSRSIHTTLAKEVNQVRTAFGATTQLAGLTDIPVADTPANSLELADDLLRRLCLRCHLYSSGDPYPLVGHGAGCAACHLDFKAGAPATHSFIAVPDDKQCLQCHYSNWVGADYHGRYEHDFNEEYRTPYITKDPTVRPYGIEYHQLVPDIHQQKGLICVDCHSGAELMNTQKKARILCQDCHLQQRLENALPPRVSYNDGRYLLSSQGTKKNHEIPLMRHPAHTAARDNKISCQACHAQWAFNDSGTHLLRNDTNEHDAFWKLTTQGSWEVEKILTHNLNSSPSAMLPPTMRDKISGEEKKGIWHQGYTMRRWEQVQLGRDENGWISVMRPVLDLHLSWIDEARRVRFDAVPALAPTDGSPLSSPSANGLRPYVPHTTGPAGMFYQQRIQAFLRTEKK